MRITGPVLVGLMVVLAALLGWQTYLPFGADTALGISLGAASLAAMSVTLMLATRPRFLEPLFGGLDRMYVVHKWLGITALALMIGHDAFEPELDRVVRETNLGEFASDLGELAFNGLIGLILISWIKRIPFTRLELPWPLWRFTHRFTGLLFAFAAFHQLAIDKPAGLDPSLDLYLDVLSVAGILAWLYTQFVALRIRPRPYEVVDVSRHATVTELELRPAGSSLLGSSMQWRPGQFAFVSATGAGMSESHPFTIASAPDRSGHLRLAIKSLGDWTRKLPDRLRPGQLVQIEGPYGRFCFKPRVRHQVWLAGGVGITPFLSWAQALTPGDGQTIVLVWSVARHEDVFATEVLTQACERHPGFSFHVVVSETQGRLTAQQLAKYSPVPVRDSELFYCGPVGLCASIMDGLRQMGQSPRRLHQEKFEFR